MSQLQTLVEKQVGSIRLVVRTARTAGTGISAHVEVYNGKLLFSDDVRLSKDTDRRRFARRVLDTVPKADKAAIFAALLELGPELEKVATESERERPTSGEEYEARSEGLYWLKPTNEGHIPTRLCNFTARIVTDIVEDDGATETRYFEIEASQSGERKRFVVSAEEFTAMNWPLEKLGASAITYPSFNRERLRAAIQYISTGVEERRVFAHVGWRRFGDQCVYLHSGGGIGANGGGAAPDIDLSRLGLTSYELPEPSSDTEEVKLAIRAALDVLDVAPKTLTYPLLTAVYRAPLAEVSPADLSIFVEGQSGSQKTSLTAVLQSFYGANFDISHLPGIWESTANALELQAFLVKDAVFVVDDFKPKGNKWDIADLHKKADRLLRGQANQQGRSRMTADASLRPSYHPRGIIISSGEDIPAGQSLRARIVTLPIQKGEVCLDKLSKAQRDAHEGLLAQAMASYLKWLAPQLEELRTSMPARQNQLRDRARAQGVIGHDRTPANIASLAFGFETFLRCAEETGAISTEERARVWDEGWQALVEVGKAQQLEQDSQNETERYIEILSSAISTGLAHVASAGDNGEPPNPTDWGWKEIGVEYAPKGTRIGWISEQEIYLDPTASYNVAQRIAEQEGERLTTSKDTLQKRLQQAGYLGGHDNGRSTVRRDIGDLQKRVLFLKPGVLGEKSGQTGPSGPQNSESRA